MSKLNIWVKFEKAEDKPGRKTDRWFVYTIDMHWLGEIKWFSRWRQYTFFPDKETVYNPACLLQIVEFCSQATVVHRIMLHAKKHWVPIQNKEAASSTLQLA